MFILSSDNLLNKLSSFLFCFVMISSKDLIFWLKFMHWSTYSIFSQEMLLWLLLTVPSFSNSSIISSIGISYLDVLWNKSNVFDLMGCFLKFFMVVGVSKLLLICDIKESLSLSKCSESFVLYTYFIAIGISKGRIWWCESLTRWICFSCTLHLRCLKITRSRCHFYI